MLTIHAPAKLNLFFEVYGKRPDGFHEVASVALPIQLFDTLEFEEIDGADIEFECRGGSVDIPVDGGNIVVRAIRLFQKRIQASFGRQPQALQPGLRVRLFKKIPSRAGLGGGSSDAVAALRGVWQFRMSDFAEKRPDEVVDEILVDKIMVEVAAEIGSDCPLFLHKSATLSRGRGETVQPVKISPSLSPLHFVVFKPAQGLSTAEVYARCMPLHDGRFRQPDELLAALAGGDLPRVAQCLFNRLEVPAREIWPEFDSVRRELERLDCLAVGMSGSGTAFYGLCHTAEHANDLAGRLRSRIGPDGCVFAVAGGM